MLGFIRLQDDQVRQSNKALYLDDLRVDEPATVLSIDSSDLTDRLGAVGICPGVGLRLLRHGSAVVVHAEGGRFCLREEDARRIMVQPVVTESDGHRSARVA